MSVVKYDEKWYLYLNQVFLSVLLTRLSLKLNHDFGLEHDSISDNIKWHEDVRDNSVKTDIGHCTAHWSHPTETCAETQ